MKKSILIAILILTLASKLYAEGLSNVSLGIHLDSQFNIDTSINYKLLRWENDIFTTTPFVGISTNKIMIGLIKDRIGLVVNLYKDTATVGIYYQIIEFKKKKK